MTTDVDNPDALTDTEYAERYLWPERAELDLRVRALLRGRGWKSRLSDSEDLGEKWNYPGSFGGRTPNCRIESGIEVLAIGVEAGPPAVFRVHGCGVHQGCAAHASVEQRVLLDEENLLDLLDELERQAREVDTAAVVECLIFGPCGRHSRVRDW